MLHANNYALGEKPQYGYSGYRPYNSNVGSNSNCNHFNSNCNINNNSNCNINTQIDNYNYNYNSFYAPDSNYDYRTFSPNAPSTGSLSSDDLLPDLWEPESSAPTSALSTPEYLPQPAVMLRDASLEYARSLLPHSLLAPLTEENLGTLDEKSQSGLDFRKPSKPHKSRQGLMSLTSSKGKGINTQLYKTELCVLFVKMGVCPYGNKCQFAHGNNDLKRVERPANWRSKPCANWTKYGLCRYGKRCCFKHGD